MQKVFTHISALTIFFGTSFFVAQAAGGQYTNPIAYGGVDSIPKLLLALVDLVFLIGAPIVVLCIIYAGFLFVQGGDNEAQMAKAKTVFTWTIVGALVLLGAKAIATAIEGTVASLGG